MDAGHWYVLVLGLAGGFALCFTTLTAYVWKSRYQEGAHDVTTGKLKR